MQQGICSVAFSLLGGVNLNIEFLTLLGFVVDTEKVSLTSRLKEPDSQCEWKDLKSLEYHKVIGFRILDVVSLSDFIVDLDRVKKSITNNSILKSHIGRYYERDMYINIKNNIIVYLGKGSALDRVVSLGKTPILDRDNNVLGSKYNGITIKLGNISNSRCLHMIYNLEYKKPRFAININNKTLCDISNMSKITSSFEANLNNEMSVDKLNKYFRLTVRSRGWYCKVRDLVICDLDRTLGSFKVDSLFTKFICNSNNKAFNLIIFPPNIQYIAFNKKRALNGVEILINPSTSIKTVVKVGNENMSLYDFVERANEFKCKVGFY